MKKICYMPGDDTGQDLMKEALKVLNAVGKYELVEAEIGYSAFQKYGTALPQETIDKATEADAILFSALTSPPDTVSNYKSGIVGLRQKLEMYANVRPCKALPNTNSMRDDIDMVIVRENTEGMYSGIEWKEGDTAYAKRVISAKGCDRVIRYAFEYAKLHGRKKVTLVHKANVLRQTCGLFLEMGKRIAKEYSEIEMEDVIIDAMAMRLIKHPQNFDVIVTTNLFGDIISDEAAQLIGGLGMTPSMNYGDEHALFEPTHGSCPKYAGKNIVNPCATLLSVAMMFDYLGEKQNFESLSNAIHKTLSEGKVLTKDLGGTAGTSEMVDEIIKKL